ncbi:acid phosphatase [Type-D symbiont of Plautia stali]|uniref:acid phosphatase n=1 Tax=Type-D symbiont of Plautia stali TaxID=1560356 RepID=UPI00073E1FC5|nr:phosphatase PAP2 family protein [Type-D symbiont of Plautia stali]
MKTRYTLIATVLLLAQQAHATTLPQAAALAAQTSTGATPGYTQLEQQSLQAERKYLQGDSATLKRDLLEKAKQTSTQADKAWLKSSGYDFKAKQNQQAGIALLSGFSTLPASVLDASRATVTSINLNATQNVRHQALQDAEAISSLYFLSDAMGPRLGKAFLAAYDKGEIGKAAALIKASEVSTSAAKKHFNYPRPFLHEGNTIHLVPDDVVVKDNVRYTADGGSFPSGHTNTGYTDALLMAEMVPERFEALVTRGARYGYSRLVLGVHYPLDVMGSRMVAERNVATYLNDARYQVLFKEARDQLRTALEKECGTSLAECARTAGKDDPYRSPDMKTFYRFTMSYNLPKADVKNTPVQVPQGAEILLKTAMPHLSDAQIRNLMVKTALPNGYPLSGNTEQSFWQRVDLTAAYAMAK